MTAIELRDGHRFGFEAMASRCEVRIDGLGADAAASAAAAAIAEVRRIETHYSRYRPDSIVSRINAAAGGADPVEVDDETAALLDFAAQLHAQSDGLFDITSGVLRRVWDFRAQRLPAPAALAEAVARVGWTRVEWDGRALRLPEPGMEIDFGGFGKEYAADRAATVLEARGVRHGFVNLGGDIRLVGPRADGQPWQFGIQHPREPAGTVASVALSHGALATSGDYERFFVHEGRRYCHILDPRSGWPVTTWQSVSVTSPACIAAGALSTIAMLKGSAAPGFLQAQHAAYLAVDAAGQLHHQGL
jgi:thiamine biosynthesis lipoprotein